MGRQAGYTLIELMIVVSIMGMVAMMAAPELGAWRNDARQKDAAYEVLRLFELAQNRLLSSSHAQLLRLSPGANGLGLLEIHDGMNHSCLKTPWDLSVSVAAFDAETANPPGTSRTLNATLEIDGVESATGVLCLEPSGRIYTGTSTATMGPQTDLAIFRIRGTSGVPRLVLVEPGGRARVQR